MILQIDKEFEELIPPLMPEEFAQLESNIIADGCREPLTVWSETIVDGHNRYKICTEHSIEYKTVPKEFLDKQAAVEWIIRNQFGRRNLTAFQRSELALRLKPIIQEKAKANMVRAGELFGEKHPKEGCQKSDKAIKKVDTKKEVAKLAGVSHDTIKKAEIIKNEGTAEQISRARIGGRGNSVNAVFNEVKNPEGKICKECGKTLPVTEFYTGTNVCKKCKNSKSKIVDFKGNVIRSTPEADELCKEHAQAIVEDLYNEDREVSYTIEDMRDEIESLNSYYIRNVRACLRCRSEVLESKANKQEVRAMINELAEAVKELKEEML